MGMTTAVGNLKHEYDTHESDRVVLECMLAWNPHIYIPLAGLLESLDSVLRYYPGIYNRVRDRRLFQHNKGSGHDGRPPRVANTRAGPDERRDWA